MVEGRPLPSLGGYNNDYDYDDSSDGGGDGDNDATSTTQEPLCEGRGTFVRVSIDHENDLCLALTITLPFDKLILWPTNAAPCRSLPRSLVHSLRWSFAWKGFSI